MWLRRGLACGLASVVLWSASASFAQAPAPKILTLKADDWCPINCDPADKHPGIGVELAKAIFEPLGYQIHYTLAPWTQALEEVRAGKIDMVVGASRFDEPTLIFPQAPVYNIGDDFYVRKGNPWRYQGAYTLRDKKMGVIADYGYGEVVTQYIKDNKPRVGIIQEATGETALKENIGKLIAGKIDVIVESKPVMEYTLLKMRMEDKIEWAGGVAQAPVFVAFSPAKTESKKLAAQFDAGIARLKASGALDKMYAVYNLKP